MSNKNIPHNNNICQPPDIPYFVKDESSISHFAMIPYLIDDSDLSAAAIRLYLHLKRVAGDDGVCWQGVRHLAQFCQLDKGTIVIAKGHLAKAGLIRIERQIVNNHPAHIITIIDIWKANKAHFQIDNQQKEGGVVRKCGTTLYGNAERKNTPKKNNLISVNNKDINTSSSFRKPYGEEFKNVMLTDKEYKKLEDKFGSSELKEKIEQLSLALESHGYKFPSHYATILLFHRRANEQKEGDNGHHQGKPRALPPRYYAGQDPDRFVKGRYGHMVKR